MTDTLSIALAQLNPTVGDIDGNTRKLVEARRKAAAAGADSGFVVLEMSHPLNSSDDDHDFSLSTGQTVGFDVLVHLSSIDSTCANGCFADTWFPTASGDGSGFGDIIIADSSGGGGTAGTTTLSISKTAEGFGENDVHYAWWMIKQISPPGDTILPGETATVHYTIPLVRSPALVTQQYGARGRLCVSNTGTAATDSLILLDHVQYELPDDSGFRDVSGAIISGFPAHAEVAPGATACYDYEVTFSGIQGAAYRNVAQALINNYDGHAGEFFGPETTVPFTVPDTLPLATFDATGSATACVKAFRAAGLSFPWRHLKGPRKTPRGLTCQIGLVRGCLRWRRVRAC